MGAKGQSILVSVTGAQGTKVFHFSSLTETKKFLRSEGCRIANSALTNLEDDDLVTVTTPDAVYDIEKEVMTYGYKRSKK